MHATAVHADPLPEPPPTLSAAAGARARPGILRRGLRRLRRGFWPAVLFAPAYSGAVAGAVTLHFVWREQAFNVRAVAVLVLFALGALTAGFLSWLCAAMIAGHRPLSARFAAMLISLAVSTAGLTAFLFFLQFRVYYAQWHSSELTLLWLYQLAFTGASAVYIFMSSGLRLLLPFGLPVLFTAAWLFARRPRD